MKPPPRTKRTPHARAMVKSRSFFRSSSLAGSAGPQDGEQASPPAVSRAQSEQIGLRHSEHNTMADVSGWKKQLLDRTERRVPGMSTRVESSPAPLGPRYFRKDIVDASSARAALRTTDGSSRLAGAEGTVTGAGAGAGA